MLEALDARIRAKKARLDRMRPLAASALAQLQKHYDVELTFTSIAIEGNTLTLRETAEVIAHGITVGGKSLRDHLEAVDHYDALLWMREQATSTTPVGENFVCELHRRIATRSQPAIAGIYSRYPRRIAGSPVIFQNAAKIPALMSHFGTWLATAAPGPEGAFQAHFDLTAIHPFADGNGRTARLLMNFLLIRDGFPPVAVRPEDRKRYLDSLERASVADDFSPYRVFMNERLDATLEDYLSILQEPQPRIAGEE